MSPPNVSTLKLKLTCYADLSKESHDNAHNYPENVYQTASSLNIVQVLFPDLIDITSQLFSVSR